MNRKFVLLNLVLAGVVVFAGVKLRDEYRAEKAREAALRKATIKPLPPPIFSPLANDPPVMPSGYKEVAMKTLFHPSRDPNEVVHVQQAVQVTVLEVDLNRRRISLSMRGSAARPSTA